VIVTDDEDRENEGDLVMAAEKATPEAINFMAMHGRGLICVPVSNERAEQLGLQRMVAQNREMYKTDFTVSVDAAHGVTTGISAHDRAATIQTIANPKSTPGRSRAAGPHLSAARERRRRPAPRGSHGSGGRSGAARRAEARGRSLRDPA
jgi:3,4-dihydroxy 2-butanone 4-phosphate synthase/GTP cyclohydrolase II